MHPYLVNRLPFMGTTSLLQVAWLQQSFFPGPNSKDSVGVITFKKSSLVRARHHAPRPTAMARNELVGFT
jgi:hypothetical protein